MAVPDWGEQPSPKAQKPLNRSGIKDCKAQRPFITGLAAAAIHLESGADHAPTEGEKEIISSHKITASAGLF